jgi:hypothetical protein
MCVRHLPNAVGRETKDVTLANGRLELIARYSGRLEYSGRLDPVETKETRATMLLRKYISPGLIVVGLR